MIGGILGYLLRLRGQNNRYNIVFSPPPYQSESSEWSSHSPPHQSASSLWPSSDTTSGFNLHSSPNSSIAITGTRTASGEFSI
jgi:hypothetical protein